MGRLSVKRLACKALQIRRKHAGFLLASIKLIKSTSLKECNDFGKGCHSSSAEPYFYEAAYHFVRDSPIPVNEKGECVVAKEVVAASKNEEGKDAASNSNPSQAGSAGCVADGKVSDKGPAQSKMWKCSKQCKPLSDVRSMPLFVLGQLLSSLWRKSLLNACGLPLWSLHQIS